MKMLDLAADTDLGKQRKDNQDTFICKALWSDDQGLIGVIDGVGGYEGGEVAAKIAKDCIEFYMSSPKGDALSMLKEAVVLANNQISEARDKDPQLAQMCCVLTVAVADARNKVLYYVHVGDTRLYLFRTEQLEKITKDHSLVGVREDAGILTEEEAMQHPRRNIILRQVGAEQHRIDDPDFLEFGEIEFLPGDEILICSDGLSDMLTREQMTAVFKEQPALPAIVTGLIRLANEAGGNDNITVVLGKNLARQKSKTKATVISTPDPSVAEPIQMPATRNAKKSSLSFVSAVLASALVLFTAFWFFRKAPVEIDKPIAAIDNTVKTVAIGDTGLSRSPNNSATAVSLVAPLDSLQMQVNTRNGKEMWLEQTGLDTIRLAQPISLGKINRLNGGKNKTIVLMPDPVTKPGWAIEVTGSDKARTKRDTIFLKNMILDGFGTGIHVEGHIILHLDNVIFRGVPQSVTYQAIDSVKSGYLTF